MEFVSSLLGVKETEQSGLFTQEKIIAKDSDCHLGKKLQQYDQIFSLSRVSVKVKVFIQYVWD